MMTAMENTLFLVSDILDGSPALSDIIHYSGRTKNYVEIPTQYSHRPLEIMVRGESSIRISGKTNHKKWNKKTTATWSASIVAEPSPFGLRLKVIGGAQPVVSEVEAEGECVWDLVQLHGNYMPKSVDIMMVVDALRETLEGTWDYSCPGSTTYALVNPVFTSTGHLIVSLVSQNNAAAVVANTTTTTTTTTTTVAKATTVISKTSTIQISNNLLTTSSAGLLVTAGSDEESPLPTPALDLPTVQIETATMTKGFGYGAPTDIKMGYEDTEIVEPYETAF